MKAKKAKRRIDKLRELERDIENVRYLVDNEQYMRRLDNNQRHNLCNNVLDLQQSYKRMTGNYYLIKKRKV